MAYNPEKQSLLSVEEEDFQKFPPLSPLSQYVDSTYFAIPVIAVFELEIPLDKAQTFEFLRDVFIPLNRRFSSIIVKDKKGVHRWKRVKVEIEDHVFLPNIPSGLTPEENEIHLEKYMTKIGLDMFPEGRPPWKVYVFPFPTTKGAGTLIYKLSHALGDGYSLMGAIFKGLKRADNPSLPPTFPNISASLSRSGRPSYVSRVTGFVSKCVNTVSDSVLSLMHGTFYEDDKTPIRSGRPRVEFQPLSFSDVTFDIDHIKRIRAMAGGTVNDVTTAMISYGLELYMKKIDGITTNRHVTAIVVLNMRMFKGFQSIEAMLKANIWGNYFGILHVRIPSSSDPENVDPLEFIVKSKEEMKRKRNSLAILFTSKLLALMRHIRCSDAGAKYIHSTFNNTSMLISNMVGPTQKVVIADRPINSFYFSLSGIPQSLILTLVSYDGKMRLVVAAEKEYIDSKLLISCMKEAFDKIYEAACGEPVVTN